MVIDPEVPGPGYADVAGTEERAVGHGGEGGFHLFFRTLKVGGEAVLSFVEIGDFLQSYEELFVLGDVLRHRTG